MDVKISHNFWQGKRVFLTGHTGFKGSWLSLWLQKMGASVYGYALYPPTEPNLFHLANVSNGMSSSVIADICDASVLRDAMREASPEIVFHLAAQPLVQYSYKNPAETYATNVMGTVNLLEAIRSTSGIKAIINVTTDKCYENKEWVWGYRENDPMGGFDPYSSSKGCAELITAAYRQSYLKSAGVALASARAGNVIGGGDWAENRLIPDLLRAIHANETLKIRCPRSTRPWQHVLEPLSGYLMLAERLYTDGASFSEAWNFGPIDEDTRSVQWIIEHLANIRSDIHWTCEDAPQSHETHSLKLDSSKARLQLNWKSTWNLEIALTKVIDWHNAWLSEKDMQALTYKQIAEYESHVSI